MNNLNEVHSAVGVTFWRFIWSLTIYYAVIKVTININVMLTFVPH